MATTSTFVVKYAAAWLALIPLVLQAGIQPFDLLLPPTEAFVHYNDGYIRAPGFIDLNGVTFTAVSEAFDDMDDIYMGEDSDFDEEEEGGGDETSPDGTTEDEGISTQPPRRHKQQRLGEGVEENGTYIDIAVFRLPRSCARTTKGCDWADLGVGKRSDYDDSMRWCCSDEAIDLGICDEEEIGYGRLIIDKDKYKGEHRSVVVPSTGPMAKSISNGLMEQSESGTYVVLYANCNERGREVYVTGESVWKSVHGYVPGELYGFMIFYTVITVIYFGLLIWYGISMYVNEKSRIKIENWILFAICLGLLEMIFRTGDYFVWNADGYRSPFIMWIAVLAGALKQGLSRCLIVMVSLGWGVVRDSLGSAQRTLIVFLGAVYILVTAVSDLMVVFAIEDMNSLSYTTEEHIFTVVKKLTVIASFIDFIFIIWILYALYTTMRYLRNMNQSCKLERYVKLRCLLLFLIMFATMWTVFMLVDSVNEESILQEEHAWTTDAASEIKYLFLLIGVAFLWRPNPSAREYAYVMELPAMGADGENKLELMEAVPSEMDNGAGSVGGTPNSKNAFSDNEFHDDHPHDNRFQMT